MSQTGKTISQDEILRIIARGKLMCGDRKKPDCTKTIWVNFFFDGTNNNRERDLIHPVKNGKPRNQCSHSNIAALFDACHGDKENGQYKYYMPGVGTIFREIGEHEPNSQGLSAGDGGQARISYALYQLCNSITHARSQGQLFNDHDYLRPLGPGFDASNIKDASTKLSTSIGDNRTHPQIAAINIAVFGFSRGAAEARAFCCWLEMLSSFRDGQWLFARCIPIRVYFLGLFDTVCSVGIAHSSPFIGTPRNHHGPALTTGHSDWAEPGQQRISAFTRQCRHYVAAHEIRYSFPLTSVRNEDGSMPAGAIEILFPGAHSDIGGGYGPGDQGKSVGGRQHLLAQIPLQKMYEDARRAGVPLMAMQTLHDEHKDVLSDFQCSPDLWRRFNAYMAWKPGSGDKIEELAYHHLQHYWRWRLAASPRFSTLHCIQQLQAGTARGKRADHQDLEDLQASEKDWLADIRHVPAPRLRTHPQMPGDSNDKEDAYPLLQTSSTERGEMRDLRQLQREQSSIPAEVDELFDRHIHDSHASFYVLGPSTRWQRQQKIAEVHYKNATYQMLYASWQQLPAARKQYTPAPEPLTAYELRIVAATPAERGKAAPTIDDSNFPLMNDADYQDLKRGGLRGRAGSQMSDTRREGGGHLHQRSTFAGVKELYAPNVVPLPPPHDLPWRQ